MTLELYEELEVKTPFNTNNHESILMSNSSIGGRTIDRCSPRLRDPLRAKSLNPLLAQVHNKSKLFTDTKGKKKVSEKRRNEVLYSSPASSQRYLLSSNSNSEDFLEQETFPCVIEKYNAKVEEPNVVIKQLEEASVENVKVVGELNDAGSSSSSTTTTTTISEVKEQQQLEESRIENVKVEELNDEKTPASTTAIPKEQQVVVLRVSLHCKGCEGKVRKHISKMEGVTSFKTDLINKKVTVVGDVTPLSVLNSISKVKNAQLWPSQPQAVQTNNVISI